MPAKLPIRVFQVATGNVGSEMIKRITNHPDLELVGLHCYTPEKIGRDAGEIVGIAPIGVTATGSVEEIIAAKLKNARQMTLEEADARSLPVRLLDGVARLLSPYL